MVCHDSKMRRIKDDEVYEELFQSNTQAGRLTGQIHAQHDEFRPRESGGLGHGVEHQIIIIGDALVTSDCFLKK